MYDEGCPHQCEYCEGLDEAAHKAEVEALREWGERMRALPEDHPDRRMYDMQMKWALELLKVKPFGSWGPFDNDMPVKFTIWSDLKDEGDE